MSDSDSEALSPPANLPGDAEIESKIHEVARAATKSEEEGVTTNIVRSRVEEQLGLDAGFLKENVQWKAKSRDLISAAFEEPASPEQPKKKRAPKAQAGTKRKSDEAQGAKKRQKKSPSPIVESDNSEDENGAGSAAEESDGFEAYGLVEKPKARSKSADECVLSDPPSEEDAAATKQNGKPATTTAAAEDDESDLSSVIDDPPPKKKRQKKKSSPPAPKTKTQKPTASKPDKPKPAEKSKPELSPDEEEIKRLQSWLLKCGVRKLWHRELAPYDSPKEKIKHLKKMLDDVGMTGRYSAEKARQIKEVRELKAELEAAREFNEQWGQEEEEEAEQQDTVKRTRGLRPKGLVDLGSDGDDSD
ncbi:hypothetical protein LTR37_003879 [Vermiconidia calcicola]|uniref:Uncharacterized protein n=1 Tax=Vermiconidia calcicola TaxID=1690605 RepID=A0ACC3NPX6_9PEZI|nr:hypothetical protein LTR37_003879 [Vermiconidia calcicola]